MKHLKRVMVPAVGAALLVTAAACSSSSGGSGSGSSGSGNTVTVLYSNNYVFNSDALATQWWNGIAKQWKAKYPHTKLVLEGTGGTDIDLMNKAAILFRSPSTTPDVIQLPTTYVAQFAGSNYLEPLNSFVQSPRPRASGHDARRCSEHEHDRRQGVRDQRREQQHRAGLQQGDADQGGRQDALAPDELGSRSCRSPAKVKAANPGVWPLWVAAGVAAGPTNVLQGSGNLIFGSTNSTMFDTKTQEMGREFLRDPGNARVLPEDGPAGPGRSDVPAVPCRRRRPASAADEAGQAGDRHRLELVPDGLGVSAVRSAMGGRGKTAVGSAPFPTENGQAPGAASTLGGWAYAVSKASKNVQAAEDFIALASSPSESADHRRLVRLRAPVHARGREAAVHQLRAAVPGRLQHLREIRQWPCPTTSTSRSTLARSIP